LNTHPTLVGAAAATLLLAHAGAAGAQGYHLRLDTRVQSVAYRGVAIDSIPVADTLQAPGRGPTTPDGFAVVCPPNGTYCTFFRPGPERSAQPFTATADVTVWGIGVPGLSVHGLGRVGWDLSGSDLWPGTDPAVQLLQGYAEYAARRGTARLGRQVVTSRFGTTGFDGAGIVLREPRRGLDLRGYLGWGLARGAALPVTSPATNPLADFQPRSRQIVAGAGLGWRSSSVDARLDYERQVDRRTKGFVSERVGVQAAVRPLVGVSLTGGADYDMAAGWWGSAEAALAYSHRVAQAQLGLRRYRPHFELWTIWGAFSPVPYHAWDAALALRAHRRVTVRARYERYAFDNAEASTPLFQAENDGWRWDVGGTVTAAAAWTVDGAYRVEYGPGAASRGVSGSVAYAPSRRLSVRVVGAATKRPLEYRFNEAVVRMLGVDAEFEPTSGMRVGVTASRYDEDHRRPDAAAYQWDQFRLAARVVLDLGSGADVRGLPPAIRLLPGGRADR